MTADGVYSTVSTPVTALLADWSSGNSDALNRLITLLYDELKRLAARQARGPLACSTLGAFGTNCEKISGA